MSSVKFDPNRLTFDQGIERIHAVVKEMGLNTGEVITSRDDGMTKALDMLAVDNVPGGFRKWQLPVYLNSPSQLYITVGEPGARASTHSHNEGDGVRFMVGGSITFNDKELTTGDWMYIPAGKEYGFEVGRLGAIMCYCYCCCCA